MATRPDGARRGWAAAGAVLGAFALLLELTSMLALTHANGGDVASAVWRFFGYFTILTNLLVVLDLALWAVLPGRTWLRFAQRAALHTAFAVAIVVVAIVYHVLLAQLWQPHGWQWLADQLLHSGMPLVFVLYWWFAMPKAALRWQHAAACVVYPFAYAVYVFARGAADGWYPYPFLDVGALGYPRVIANLVGLAAGFVVLGFGAIALGRWQAARAPRSFAAR